MNFRDLQRSRQRSGNDRLTQVILVSLSFSFLLSLPPSLSFSLSLSLSLSLSFSFFLSASSAAWRLFPHCLPDIQTSSVRRHRRRCPRDQTRVVAHVSLITLKKLDKSSPDSDAITGITRIYGEPSGPHVRFEKAEEFITDRGRNSQRIFQDEAEPRKSDRHMSSQWIHLMAARVHWPSAPTR